LKYLPLFLIFISTPIIEVFYSFEDFVERVETEYKLPRGILHAIAQVESRLNPRKIHKNDGPGHRTSYGLLQIQEPSARQVGFKGKPSELLTPEVNIYFGALYLNWLIKETRGDIPRALNCYNAGRSSKICREKTSSRYSDKVLNSYLGGSL
jgi:soluble lytic murein transglycosylase-like protein